MTDRYEKIRNALAMGPTPGPWGFTELPRDMQRDGYKFAISRRGIGWRFAQIAHEMKSIANATYITACDPDTIRELLAERDALAAENARLRADRGSRRAMTDRYRKKPVEVRAWKISFGEQEPDWVREAFDDERIEWCSAGEGLYINTLEGRMKASIGDMLIEGVNGEMYGCRADIFAATYEPVETTLAAPKPDAVTGPVDVEALREGAKYEYEVWQDGALRAGGRELDYASAQSEANHYATMYTQDGPVEVRIYEKRLLTYEKRLRTPAQAKPKLRRYNASGSLSEYGVFPESDAQ